MTLSLSVKQGLQAHLDTHDSMTVN